MDNKVNIEIDGKKIEAEQGAMIIEAADDNDIYIPRFCYHKKLTVAANCRMCLIELEGGRKAMPACATPITDGMKIKTRSELARKAQKAVMEFLLINHPLDCPICDQGGQCELQDLAMGYGHAESRYDGPKTVVKDQSLGSLIATDMTRCIKCTRCVRFGKEIAGEPELGTLGRGEHVTIGNFIERAVRSELSGNMIDVCPVGALTSKPFRFSARAWELQQRPSIAAHDCLGSNINVHSIHDEVKRVVPHENEAINEVWLSDRDRFSYVGLNSEQRVTKPLLKKDGAWQEVDWTTALEIIASSFENIKKTYGADAIAALISANSSVEEQFLLQKIIRDFGSSNIDHRIRQTDFSDQHSLPVMPSLGVNIADIENLDAALFIGADVQREQPLLIARLLKASRQGGQIMTANVYDINAHFMGKKKLIAAPEKLLTQLCAVIKALGQEELLDADIKRLIQNVDVSDAVKEVAAALQQGHNKAIILGAIAQNSAHAATFRYLGQWIAKLSGASYGILTQGANTQGAWVTGCVSHRGVGGEKVKHGKNAAEILATTNKANILYNIEPEFDSANPCTALKTLQQAEFNVVCSPYVTETMQEYADIILPITPFSETDGTFINANGTWQSFNAAVTPLGESRPGWKVLRVLGNFLDLPGFEYTRAEDICAQVKQSVQSSDELQSDAYAPAAMPEALSLQRIGVWPLYRTDNIVRRSQPLQDTLNSAEFGVRINQDTAAKFNVAGGDMVEVIQDDNKVELPVIIDSRACNDCAYIAAGVLGSEKLGAITGAIEIVKKG